ERQAKDPRPSSPAAADPSVRWRTERPRPRPIIPRMNGASGSLQGIDEGIDGWARRISAELCAVLLDTLGLPAAIAWHVRRFQKSTGVLYQLEVNDAAGFELPEDCAATIFDAYRMALISIARHTQPSRIAIALTIPPR